MAFLYFDSDLYCGSDYVSFMHRMSRKQLILDKMISIDLYCSSDYFIWEFVIKFVVTNWLKNKLLIIIIMIFK